MKNVHGDVHAVNKTTLAKLNKVLKKKGKLESKKKIDDLYKVSSVMNKKGQMGKV